MLISSYCNLFEINIIYFWLKSSIFFKDGVLLAGGS